MQQYILTTKRCKIREIEETEEDIDFIIKIWNDKSVIQGIGDRNIRTYQDGIDCINRMKTSYKQHQFGSWVVEYYPSAITEEQETKPILIGIAGILKRDYLTVPDVGWAFFEQYQFQSFGVEITLALLDWCKAHLNSIYPYQKLSGFLSPDNIGSKKLLLKCGFQQGNDFTTPNSEEICEYYEIDLE
jgi:RimJ/RimL family protein N-acetyltransferase